MHRANARRPRRLACGRGNQGIYLARGGNPQLAEARARGARWTPRCAPDDSGRRRRRLLTQPLDHGLQRLALGGPARSRLAVDRELALRTGTAFDDAARALPPRPRSRAPRRRAAPARSIPRAARDTRPARRARGPEAFPRSRSASRAAIISYQQLRILAPTLVAAAQSPQHPQQAGGEGREADRIVDRGAAVHDARLERRVARTRAGCPTRACWCPGSVRCGSGSRGGGGTRRSSRSGPAGRCAAAS